MRIFTFFKPFIFIPISILSQFLGCQSKKETPKTPNWPAFPENDNSQCIITPIILDSSYVVSSFLISPDKKFNYVLCQRYSSEKKSTFYKDQRFDYRLFILDSKANILYSKSYANVEGYYGGSLGFLNGELLFRVGNYFQVLDKKTFDIIEKIPVYQSHFFPSKDNIELMTFDEQRDSFQILIDKLDPNTASNKYLFWPPRNEHLIFVEGPAGKRVAWCPLTYSNEELSELIHRFKPLSLDLNPSVNGSGNSTALDIKDDLANIKEADNENIGTELVYPNYKERHRILYELSVHAKTVHFTTSDKGGNDLRLGFADNFYLCMEDGSVWLMRHGILYRIE